MTQPVVHCKSFFRSTPLLFHKVQLSIYQQIRYNWPNCFAILLSQIMLHPRCKILPNNNSNGMRWRHMPAVDVRESSCCQGINKRHDTQRPISSGGINRHITDCCIPRYRGKKKWLWNCVSSKNLFYTIMILGLPVTPMSSTSNPLLKIHVPLLLFCLFCFSLSSEPFRHSVYRKVHVKWIVNVTGTHLGLSQSRLNDFLTHECLRRPVKYHDCMLLSK